MRRLYAGRRIESLSRQHAQNKWIASVIVTWDAGGLNKSQPLNRKTPLIP
jgi:hypothetical protein